MYELGNNRCRDSSESSAREAREDSDRLWTIGGVCVYVRSSGYERFLILRGKLYRRRTALSVTTTAGRRSAFRRIPWMLLCTCWITFGCWAGCSCSMFLHK